jgi:CheY-like chemotaxis protein
VRKRVLIVDDQQPLRAVARELLEDAGYVVAGEAADVTEALAAVVAEAPDVALLDVQSRTEPAIATTTETTMTTIRKRRCLESRAGGVHAAHHLTIRWKFLTRGEPICHEMTVRIGRLWLDRRLEEPPASVVAVSERCDEHAEPIADLRVPRRAVGDDEETV